VPIFPSGNGGLFVAKVTSFEGKYLEIIERGTLSWSTVPALQLLYWSDKEF